MIRQIKLAFNQFTIKRKEETPELVAPVHASIASPQRRVPRLGEPLAFCAKCRDWTPPEWLPPEVRGKYLEEWFRCADCGNTELVFRYMPS